MAESPSNFRHQTRDVLVSVEAAERMSRPVQDPKANSAAPDPAQTRAAPSVGLEPGLDVNGVDTSLSAAAKAISPATSGIRDEEEQHVSYGLKQGQTVEETGPDGAVRRVRVLPTSF